jgi:hypothetical protein
MRLVPDFGGRIEALATALHPELFRSAWPANDRGYRAMRRAVAAAIAALAPGMRLTIFTEARAAAAAGRWLAGIATPAALDLHALPDGAMGSAADLWLQDPALCATAADGSPLVLRPSNHMARGAASWLAAAFGGEVRDIAPALDGGDLLAGDGWLLAGADSADARLGALTGGRLHAVGARQGQPLFHIDLCIALTGLEVAGRPLLLVAAPEALRARDRTEASRLRGLVDAAAEDLAASGFAIRRLPAPLAPAPSGRRLLLRPVANAMAENSVRPGRDRPLVWLPAFGDREPDLADFDRAAAAVWRDLGFEPLTCPGWSATAHAHGALRCAFKVVRRMPESGL